MPIFRITADSRQQLESRLYDTIKALDLNTIPDSQFDPAAYRFSVYYQDIIDLKAQLSQATLSTTTYSKPWCLLFTGQGAQYPEMGYKLRQSFPVVQQSLHRMETLFSAVGADISPFFSESFSDAIHQTQNTQLCMVALELALADFWHDVGLPVGCAIGHSIGELAACIHAGYYSRSEGAHLVFERARRMQQVDSSGSMLAVRADKNTLASIISRFNSHGDIVEYAGFNSPVQTILSGSESAITNIKNHLAESAIKSVELQVSHAFHSRFMDPMLADFTTAIAHLSANKPCYRVYSNLSGDLIDAKTLTANYWSQQLRSPVDFIGCVDSAWRDGYRCFLEVGPTPVLHGLIGKIFPDKNAVVSLSSMHKRHDAVTSLLTTACRIDSNVVGLQLASYRAF